MRVRIRQTVNSLPAFKDIDMPAPPTEGLEIDLGQHVGPEKGNQGSVKVSSVTFHVDGGFYAVDIEQEDDLRFYTDHPDAYFGRLDTMKHDGWHFVREDVHYKLVEKAFADAGKPVPPWITLGCRSLFVIRHLRIDLMQLAS
jgi:hypothetical protein